MQNDKVKNLTVGNPTKLLLMFALPMMLGNVFQQMYTMMDTIIVGQGVGVNALAAVGASDWFNWMVISVALGLTQGFGIMMAQAFGAGDEKALKRTVGHSITLSVLSALVITLAAQVMIRPVLHLMNVSDTIFGGSETYLRIMFGGIPIIIAYNLTATMLRSLGNSRSPLVAMVIASLLNIALDLLFVMVFHWGIAGAAAATIMSQCVSFLYCLRVVMSIDLLRIRKGDLPLQAKYARKLLMLGMPIVFQNMIISVGGMIVTSVVNTYGVLFVAGYTATNKMYGLLEMAAISYGCAMMTYIGQNLGAGNLKRIRQGVRSGLLMAVVTSVAVSVVMLTCGRSLISLFISADAKDAAFVLQTGYTFLKIMASWLVILYLLYIYRYALQGLGDTVIPMISGGAEFVMRVGSVLFLPSLIGSSGVFYAEVLAWTGAMVILVTAFYIEFYRLCRKKREEKNKLIEKTKTENNPRI